MVRYSSWRQPAIGPHLFFTHRLLREVCRPTLYVSVAALVFLVTNNNKLTISYLHSFRKAELGHIIEIQRKSMSYYWCISYTHKAVACKLVAMDVMPVNRSFSRNMAPNSVPVLAISAGFNRYTWLKNILHKCDNYSTDLSPAKDNITIYRKNCTLVYNNCIYQLMVRQTAGHE